MAGIFGDLQMATTPATTFPILELPSEIRAMIYSCIILPPHKQSQQRLTRYRHPTLDRRTKRARLDVVALANLQYHVDRHVWHRTAQSFLQTCKRINREATPIYWAHKRLIVKDTDEYFTLQSVTGVLQNQFKFARLNEVKNLELDIRLTPRDASETRVDFSNHTLPIIRFLRTQRLPGLQSIIIKIACKVENNQLDSGLDIFSVAGQDSCRKIGVCREWGTSWESCPPYRAEDVDFMVEEAEAIYQFPDGLSRKILKRKHWECIRTLYRVLSMGGTLVYEMKFERRNQQQMKEFLEKEPEFDDNDEFETEGPLRTEVASCIIEWEWLMTTDEGELEMEKRGFFQMMIDDHKKHDIEDEMDIDT